VRGPDQPLFTTSLPRQRGWSPIPHPVRPLRTVVSLQHQLGLSGGERDLVLPVRVAHDACGDGLCRAGLEVRPRPDQIQAAGAATGSPPTDRPVTAPPDLCVGTSTISTPDAPHRSKANQAADKSKPIETAIGYYKVAGHQVSIPRQRGGSYPGRPARCHFRLAVAVIVMDSCPLILNVSSRPRSQPLSPRPTWRSQRTS
jgi:hypothetical protein